jgi:hypothetical protein
MTVEFDEFSRDTSAADEPADVLAAPERSNRKRIAIASAGGAVLLTGAVIAALVTSSGSASASTAALAAAASSSASSSAAAKPAPRGTDAHRGGGGGLGALGALAGKPILFGTVKSVSGTKILITDLQGFTRTIVTSATTTYKDGLSANPATGTKLIAMGTVASDGTDLDATTISGLPAGIGGGHPGFRGGPGGPGGSGAPGGSGGSGRPFPHPTGTPPSGFHPGERPKSTTTPTPSKTA